MTEPSEAFGLFLSCVEGQPVTRYGSTVLIGAERDLENRKLVRYDPSVIVAIPIAEARKYAREYRRAIADGSVKEQTAAAWSAQQKPLVEAGAPRSKLKADHPPEDEAAHGNPEGSREFGKDTRILSHR